MRKNSRTNYTVKCGMKPIEYNVAKALDEQKRDRLLMAVAGSRDRWASEHAVRLARSLGVVLFVLRILDIHKVFRARIHHTRILTELERETRSVVGRIGKLAREMGGACEEVVGPEQQTPSSAAPRPQRLPIPGDTGVESGIEELNSLVLRYRHTTHR